MAPALTSSHLLLTATWLTLCGMVGCTPDFEDEWLVRDLRILALRAEPPEIRLDPALQTFPEVTIDALVVNSQDPDPTAGYTWQLWACPATETRCSERPEDEQHLLTSATSPLRDIRHRFSLSPELYRQTLARDLFFGLGGVAVMVELRIADPHRPGPTGEEPAAVIGVKRIVYAESDRTVGVPNQNPQLTVTIADHPLCPTSPADELPPAAPVVLRPDPTTARETYVLPTLRGGTAVVPSEAREETPSFHFFVSAGTLSAGVTGGAENPFVDFRFTNELDVTWTTPGAEVGETTLWIVVRDERGGVDWDACTFRIR